MPWNVTANSHLHTSTHNRGAATVSIAGGTLSRLRSMSLHPEEVGLPPNNLRPCKRARNQQRAIDFYIHIAFDDAAEAERPDTCASIPLPPPASPTRPRP